VNAGVVLVELIGAQAGIIGPHQVRIGVTRTTQRGNLLPIDLALEAGLTPHRLRWVVTG